MKLKLFPMLLLAIFSLLIFGCSDDGDKPKEEVEENYSLVGTSWKLISFVDVENDTSFPPYEPYNPEGNTFWLSFGSKIVESPGMQGCLDLDRGVPFYEVTGMTAINDVFGAYFIDSTANILETCIGLTKVNEPTAEGAMFFDVLIGRNSFPFKLIRVNAQQQLKLFYNDSKNYLLFERTK